MDKYEFNIKVEQIKKLVNKGDYETAMKIADTIDWRRVRNVNILSMVATIYEKNGEYQESRSLRGMDGGASGVDDVGMYGHPGTAQQADMGYRYH